MMTKERLSGNRPSGQKFRRLFIIAAEGEKTEPEYFAIVGKMWPAVEIFHPMRGTGSAPQHVLESIKKFLEEEQPAEPYDAWVVVDKDRWTDKQLNEVHEWSKEKKNYGFALSNPKFEYWLLLHFDNGEQVTSSRDCTRKLKKHLRGYEKSIKAENITQANVERAIRRAKKRDNPRCEDWPRGIGSTVYRLVERILKT